MRRSRDISNPYKFQNFPYDPEPIVTITEESIDDPVLQFHSNLYFLLGTQGDMLKIYFSDDLFKNLWKEHPDSQHYKSKYVRNAGPILQLENKLLRFTQDCSEFYGNKIMVKEIVLDSKSYQEKIIDNDYSHNADNSFDNLGRHHISLAKFQGSTFIAMDGRTKDYKINKLLNFLIR